MGSAGSQPVTGPTSFLRSNVEGGEAGRDETKYQPAPHFGNVSAVIAAVVEDAGEPAGFLDRQVDSVEMTTALGRGFATDTVAWVFRYCSKCYLLAVVLVRGFSDAARNAVPLRPLVAHALASSASTATN